MKNFYKKFDELADLLKLNEEPKTLIVRGKPLETKTYGKLVLKGELDYFDYNRGAFHLGIQVIVDGDCFNPHETNPEKDAVWRVMLNVNTVDDGDLGGQSKLLTLSKANQLAETLAKTVIAEIVSMPTLEEFQKELLPHGLYLHQN
jgi:hypothetical protein